MARTLLVVDDAMIIRQSIKDAASEAGWTILGEASNGRQAVEMYHQARPDLVIMDITMPEMDGIAAVREIAGQDPAARIVMCSALGQQELIIAALEAGARDFVVKPFVPEKVLEAMRKVMENPVFSEKTGF